MPLSLRLLTPASIIYSAAMRLRAALYRFGVLKAKRLPSRVISVGNLAAGGTGKTPMVIYLAEMLKARGARVVVVTRGYKGAREGAVAVVSDGEALLMGPEEAGDEPVLIARRLPGVPVVMGSDRYAAGMLAWDEFRPNVVILDDAYQHVALARDLNILLLDAKRPFGNGYTFPAGYLREPASAAGRAGFIVLTRSDRVDYPGADLELDPPLAISVHRPAGLRGVWGNQRRGLETLNGEKVFALAAIAEPESFSLILEGLGAKISGWRSLPDHHAYTRADVEDAARAAGKSDADMVVTTEKDAVKLAGLPQPAGVDFLALEIGIEVIGGREALEYAIEGLGL